MLDIKKMHVASRIWYLLYPLLPISLCGIKRLVFVMETYFPES